MATRKVSKGSTSRPQKSMSPKSYTSAAIKRMLGSALRRVVQQDQFLLAHAAHERSIAHKLAEYLQAEFGNGREVDCEYNLHGHMIKRLEGIRQCSRERGTDRIFPDIAVHIRGTDEFNSLVIEMKTRDGSDACDIRKLELLTSPRGEYRYQLGAFIRLRPNADPEISWFPESSRTP